ncbi:uncharacterized protein [Amphiura filiformis]
MSEDGSSDNCDHGPSCCKICREDLAKLRSELNILRIQLQVPSSGSKDNGFALPGLDDTDANEHAAIKGCLEVIEMNTDGVPTRLKVKDTLLEALRPHKNDRPWVARRLTDLLFTKLERRISNVQGKKNKKALDPQRMAAVRDGTFQVCPAPKNDQDVLWKECIRSIDSASRGLSRDRSKQPSKRPRATAPSSSNSMAATYVNNTVSSLSAASAVLGKQQQQLRPIKLSRGDGTVPGTVIVPVTSTVQDQSDGIPGKKMFMISLPSQEGSSAVAFEHVDAQTIMQSLASGKTIPATVSHT